MKQPGTWNENMWTTKRKNCANDILSSWTKERTDTFKNENTAADMSCFMRRKENLLNTESYRCKYNAKKYSVTVFSDLNIYWIVLNVPKNRLITPAFPAFNSQMCFLDKLWGNENSRKIRPIKAVRFVNKLGCSPTFIRSKYISSVTTTKENTSLFIYVVTFSF